MKNELTANEAATYIGTTLGTLYVWRSCNRGPLSYKRGGRIYYPIEELDKWVNATKQATTRGGVDATTE